MSDQNPPQAATLESWRSYLLLLAQVHLRKAMNAKIEPSDIVQQTLLEAYQRRSELPEAADALCAWLRTALDNNIRDQQRHWLRAKRDIRREQQAIPDLSKTQRAPGAAGRFADRVSQPTNAKNRSASRLGQRSMGTARTPTRSDRTASLSRPAVSHAAQEMGTSEAAVAGLLHRGVQKLRTILIANHPESPA